MFLALVTYYWDQYVLADLNAGNNFNFNLLVRDRWFHEFQRYEWQQIWEQISCNGTKYIVVSIENLPRLWLLFCHRHEKAQKCVNAVCAKCK